MSSRKRKKYSRDVQCVFFPDDVVHCVQRGRREPPSLSAVSSARSWGKCGDSFRDSPPEKNHNTSGRKLSTIRKLALNADSVQNNAGHGSDAPVNIAWSSNDSEPSEDETQKQQLQRKHPHKPAKHTAPIQLHPREPSLLSTDEEDLPDIDSDSDLDTSEDCVEKDSGQQISDPESETVSVPPADGPTDPTHVAELEISGYASDGECVSGSLTPSRLDSESFLLQTGEGSRRSVSDWVRSAQAMMQTPQKPLDRPPKTPEDSANKRRKFQSGGFAERLNRLQCRQRSAISFWRHQSVSEDSAAATTSVDRPGVLVLKVLEVQTECSMQLVRCEQRRRRRPGASSHHGDPVPEGTAHLLVLFNRETAAQLNPAARDIIHIYPPWQSLSIEGFSCDIILNTHFSQKVFSDCKPADSSVSRGRLSVKRCPPYYLGDVFGPLAVSEEKFTTVQKVTPRFGGPEELTSHGPSLLEAVERLGQAGSVGQDVEVVLQRVFSIPAPDCSTLSVLKPRVPSRSASVLPPTEPGKTRLCVVVQDSFGMFSVVQLHPLSCSDNVFQYRRSWQGKNCVLRDIKVVRRVTRERRTRLFSLIDSLWPPVIPLKDQGNAPSMSNESRPACAPPSFCYLLSGQESSVEPTEGQTVSALYVPPAHRSLRDVVTNPVKTCRCSFVATVIHKRVQSGDVGQGEVWLVLTDLSLQEEWCDTACRRTVALCVSTSCVLTSSVLEALHSPAFCLLSFTDVIKEHDVLLCAEQSVVEVCLLQSEDSQQLSMEPEIQTLPQPVRLDPLSQEATPNSLCSLSGVIVGVDENTAYSWPVCNNCASDNLEILPERPGNFKCLTCKSVMEKPELKIQLEVFLSSSSLNDCTLKVKLQKTTIMSVLNATALEGSEFPGYDLENVLGTELGPLAVSVRVVTRKPAPWMGLEEICL